MPSHRRALLLLTLTAIAACSSSSGSTEPDAAATSSGESTDAARADTMAAETTATSNMAEAIADVTGVRVLSQDGGRVTLSVTVRSDDTGCAQYADWWEVLDATSRELLYRRILAHSHVDEQPFERSGGPVSVTPDQAIVVRAHMNTTGYGGQALRGSIGGGFSPAELEPGFAAAVAQEAPQPSGCAF